MVPLLDGMLGAIVPTRTWFGALMSILGVALLESSGSPPCVSVVLSFMSFCFVVCSYYVWGPEQCDTSFI